MTERLEVEIDAAAQRRPAMTAAEVAKRTTELEGVLDGLQPGEEALVGGQLHQQRDRR